MRDAHSSRSVGSREFDEGRFSLFRAARIHRRDSPGADVCGEVPMTESDVVPPALGDLVRMDLIRADEIVASSDDESMCDRHVPRGSGRIGHLRERREVLEVADMRPPPYVEVEILERERFTAPLPNDADMRRQRHPSPDTLDVEGVVIPGEDDGRHGHSGQLRAEFVTEILRNAIRMKRIAREQHEVDTLAVRGVHDTLHAVDGRRVVVADVQIGRVEEPGHGLSDNVRVARVFHAQELTR